LLDGHFLPVCLHLLLLSKQRCYLLLKLQHQAAAAADIQEHQVSSAQSQVQMAVVTGMGTYEASAALRQQVLLPTISSKKANAHLSLLLMPTSCGC
jgi:hypothetical protein